MTLIERFQRGEARALARLLTLIEDGDPAVGPMLADVRATPVTAATVGLTGPPGAGKSTLVNALVTVWRAQARRVAVLAVDPSSPRSGGAVLGDRVRMSRHALDGGVFIRSMAARGWPGGVAEATDAAVTVLARAHFDLVVVETVGVGQADVDIARLVDVVVLVQAPGQGDEVQALKAGLLEVADVIAVTKGDLPGAHQLVTQLTALVMPGGRLPPTVLLTAALTGEGMTTLADTILALATRGRTAPTLTPAEATARILDRATAEARRRLARLPAIVTLGAAVAAGACTVDDAAQAALAKAFGDQPASATDRGGTDSRLA